MQILLILTKPLHCNMYVKKFDKYISLIMNMYKKNVDLGKDLKAPH